MMECYYISLSDEAIWRIYLSLVATMVLTLFHSLESASRMDTHFNTALCLSHFPTTLHRQPRVNVAGIL